MELTDRAAHIPRFRLRLAPTPVGLGKPVWVDFASFDPAAHVFVVALRPMERYV